MEGKEFADTEQKYKRSGEQMRLKGEQGKYVGQLLMICTNGGKRRIFDDWQKLMICLKRGCPHKSAGSLFWA